jgi:hypothetical protein
MSLPLLSLHYGHAVMNRLRDRQKSEYRGSSLDAIARLHLDRGIAVE